VTDAVESVHSEQTLAIPVSILFDQLPLHEVKLMVEESRGLPKRPENARWLFSYARGLRHRLDASTSTAAHRCCCMSEWSRCARRA